MSLGLLTVFVLALALPGALYLAIAAREAKRIHGVEDFLPLRRYLSSSQVGNTVAAAGLSFATVFVALVDLSGLMGLAMFWALASYLGGFAILLTVTRRIMDRNPRNLTLQTFLGDEYASTSVRVTASFFAIVGHLCIFAIELVVAATLFTVFLGSWAFGFVAAYLIFILVYAGSAGYRSVVATDRWQVGFIGLAIVAFAAFTVWSLAHGPALDEALSGIGSKLLEWRAPLSFFVGLGLINLFIPLCDAATWQRVCSSNNSRTARRGVVHAMILFSAIWTALILIGLACVFVPAVQERLDAGASVMSASLEIMAGSGSPIVYGLLFLLIVGLLSAMISTADSLLIAAVQIGLTGFRHQQWATSHSQVALRHSRILLVSMGIVSFGIFGVLHWLGMNIIQLVLAVWGAQLALLPTALVALTARKPEALRRARYGAALSIAVGFIAAWTAAIYGHLSGSMPLQYYAPAIGLGFAAMVYVVGWALASAVTRMNDKPPMSFRLARPRDRDEIARIAASRPEAFLPEYADLIANDAMHHPCALAELDGQTIGFIVWTETCTDVELLYLAVRPEFGRRGFGATLVREAERRAGPKPIAYVKAPKPETIAADSGLSAESYRGTIRFYERLGYAPEAEIKDYWAEGTTALFLVKRNQGRF